MLLFTVPSFSHMLAETVKLYGRIDVLVSNVAQVVHVILIFSWFSLFSFFFSFQNPVMGSMLESTTEQAWVCVDDFYQF